MPGVWVSGGWRTMRGAAARRLCKGRTPQSTLTDTALLSVVAIKQT